MLSEKIENCVMVEEILNLMSKVAHECVACRIQGEFDECEALFDKFQQDFEYIIPKIVDMETMFWEFRHNNKVYDNWNQCRVDLWKIRRSMENQLWELA